MASPDLVQLPRMSPTEAARLISDMLLAVEPDAELPDAIERSRKRLVAARDALQDALSTVPKLERAGFRRVAEHALDAAWEAAFDWLSGWCKLAVEANPNRASARELFVTLFAGAGAFGRLPYKVELLESRSRLDAVVREGHTSTFEILGGSPFLTQLQNAQRLCERTLSADVSLDQPPPSLTDTSETPPSLAETPAPVKEKLAEAAGALRQYVMRLVAHADAEIEGSEALSASLMRPLVAWHQKHPSRAPELEFGSTETTLY